jgi:translation initiation factor 2 alpha subunit (eIF-2alpha)
MDTNTRNFNKDVQFYSDPEPKENQNVLVRFIKKNDAFFEAELVEYHYRGMMNYSDASKKKRNVNWNKVVPLNKNMIAKVESIDSDAKIVQLSIAYLENEDTDNIMVLFNENRILESFVGTICFLSKDVTLEYFNHMWTKFVHYIDNDRIKNKSDDSIWKYFNDNYEDIMDDMTDILTEQELLLIKTQYEKKNVEVIQKLVSKIGIISPSGVQVIKQFLTENLKNIKYKYTFKYEATPNFIFESTTEDSSLDDHKKFINMLEISSKTFKPPVYIKVT